MPPIAKGLILAGIAVVLQLVMELFLIRPLIGMSWGAAAGLGIAGAVVFGLYGFFVGWKEAYDFAPRTIWAFILDVSWSAINTTVGLVWMIWCAIRGTFDNTTAEAKKRGVVLFLGQDAALPGADASTLGTVMGGSWMLHEAVHVQQARIFGPLYWPVYLLSYFTALIARAVTFRFHRIHWQAYGRVVIPHGQMMETGADMVVAEARITYRASARFDDEIDLVAQVVNLGNTSMTTALHIERAPNGSSTYAVVGSAGANATSFSESPARGNYSYRVQAFNSTTGVVSAYSNVATVRVK